VAWFNIGGQKNGVTILGRDYVQFFAAIGEVTIGFVHEHASKHKAEIIIMDGMKGKVADELDLLALAGNAKVIYVSSEQLRIEFEKSKCTCHEFPVWSRDEYEAACGIDAFWKLVEEKVKEAVGNVVSDEDEKDNPVVVAVRAKFYYTGYSARWMFDCSLQEAITHVDRCVDSVDAGVAWKYVMGHQSSTNPESSTYLNYLVMKVGKSNTIVSEYARRKLMAKASNDTALLVRGWALEQNNPTLLSWVYEDYCIRELNKRDGLMYTQNGTSRQLVISHGSDVHS
jgi:hypothetical protein